MDLALTIGSKNTNVNIGLAEKVRFSEWTSWPTQYLSLIDKVIQALYRYNQVKMRVMAPHPVWLVSLEAEEKTHGHGKNPLWGQRWRLEWCVYEPEDARDGEQHQKPRERPGPDPPLEPSDGANPGWHLDFRRAASRTVTEGIEKWKC